jgi:soluble lytic murein transglycosylase
LAQVRVNDDGLIVMPASRSSSQPALRRGYPTRAVLVLATALLLAACRESTPATREAALESPAATAVSPTPAPADPALGRELQRNGQYEEAIAVYEQVITRSPEPERLPARLSLARTYLLSGRNLEARRELEVFLSQAASDSDRQVGRFLLAEALEALGDKEGALDLYYRFAQEGSPAAPYADLARARLLASLGRSEEAVAAAGPALSVGLPPVATAGALLDIARACENAGALGDAILWYERLFKESQSSADQALARWRVGALTRLRGDPNWAGHHLAVIRDYPSTPAALEALAELEEAGVSVDDYLAGLVYYRHNEDKEAQEAFEAYLHQDPPGPQDAEAAYYLGAVYEERGDEEAALDAYDDSLRRDPDGPLADDAAWWRARLLEGLARYESAISAYRVFPRQYPDSPWASEALFRSGLLLYKEEKYEEAVSAFEEAQHSMTDSDDVDRARLWLAKAHGAAGQAGEAMTILNELAKEDPSNYYSLRAAALLGEPLPSAEPGEVDLTKASSIDWAAIDAWAASWLPSAPYTSPLAFLSDPRWARANELLDLQLFDEASGEFESLLEAYGTTSPALYSLTRALYPLGLTHLSAQAASRLLAALPQPAIDAAPPDLLRLAYPVDYAPLIQSTAERTHTSPLLLAALIRQESFFNPRAGSSAGALGLTQVIPSTAREIAAGLGLEGDFSDQDLLRPAISILFGAQYLSEQLEAFDGRLAPALAAYNGGPGNASRWLKAAGEDEDLFLEEISFDQTRAYVKVVTENLVAYQALYSGALTPAPALPRSR